MAQLALLDDHMEVAIDFTFNSIQKSQYYFIHHTGFNGSPAVGPYGNGGAPFLGGSIPPIGAFGPGGLPYNGKSGAGILADEPDNNKAQKKSS